MSKTTVIYHRSDFDGFFCREIAKKFLGTEGVEYIGWDYGDPEPEVPLENTLYIMDLSVPGLMPHPKLIWIDHHKSAIAKYLPDTPGYRIDGVAACRLAWQWFLLNQKVAAETGNSLSPAANGFLLPTKQNFIDRTVSEPLAVRLAGEYDIWDKRDPNVDTFQMGLWSNKISDEQWHHLLNDSSFEYSATVADLLADGKIVQCYANVRDAEIIKNSGFVVEFEGIKFLALNSASKGSMQFAAKDVPETGHDALLKFNFTGVHWDVSLYHAAHRNDLDLSPIAKKHGGGGHAGACGFRTKNLRLSTKP